MWIDLALTQYEFEGVDGEIHAFPGCSLVGLFEMEKQLAELQNLMQGANPEVTAEELFQTSVRFRWIVLRCLQLNGINPNWTNWEIVEQMLFAPGILMQINRPKSSGRSSGGEATLEQLIAGIAHATGSISEAIELAKTQPFQPLLDIVTAYGEAGKTPEQKHDDQFSAWKERKQAEAARRKAEQG
jgi:hypothetical protein